MELKEIVEKKQKLDRGLLKIIHERINAFEQETGTQIKGLSVSFRSNDDEVAAEKRFYINDVHSDLYIQGLERR